MIELVKEFNEKLENLKQYNRLSFLTDGDTEFIVSPQVSVFDDNNYSTDYFKQIALSNLVKFHFDMLEVANTMLIEEVDKYLDSAQKRIKEQFPNATFKVRREVTMRWTIVIWGDYPEQSTQLENLVDNIEANFEYIFEGCNLDFDY